MNKKLKIAIVILTVVILTILIQIVNKNLKYGNNINKSNTDIIEYILNLSSYEAKLEVTVNSNKTSNKYFLEQYYLEPSYSKQIVKKPANIENLEIIYNGNNLEVKNSKLSLTKIYQNYNYLNDNLIWLNFFTDNLKDNYTIEYSKEECILKTNIEKYNCKGIMYINKKNNLPSKIEILDYNNKCRIYIKYTEIKLNNIQNNNIFAFKTKDINTEV